MPSGREVLLDVLEQHGIACVVGTRGAAERLAWAPRYVHATEPRVAMALAWGCARASGGPAVLDLAGPEASPARGPRPAGVPLVVLTDDQAGVPPAMKTSLHAASADELGAALVRGLAAARLPPAGLVEVRVAATAWDGQTCEAVPRARAFGTAVRADEAELTRAGALLAGAEQPLFLAGDEVGLADAWPELVALAERVGAPVYTPAHASLCDFPNRHPHWLGTLEPDPQAADVVLVCGADWSASSLPAGAQTIIVSDDARVIAQAQPAAASLMGDARTNLLGVFGALRATSQPRSAVAAATRRRSAMQHRAAGCRAEWRARIEQARTAGAPGGQRLAMAAALADALPADAIVCVDADVEMRDVLLHLVELKSPTSYWAASADEPGVSLAVALGMRLGAPRRSVLAVLDDAALAAQADVLAWARETGLEAEQVESVDALAEALAAGRPRLIVVRASQAPAED